jgi:hypothetical protein
VTTIAPATEAAEGLDLQAVSELFKESKNLEQFERSLNDPDTGVNNLDLDDDGNVDFIRVVEESSGDTRVIVLQATLGENEFQDVATIEVEKTGDDTYNLQTRGAVIVYGPNYYLAPAVRVHRWPLVVWLYAPGHHHYRPGWRWGHYPKWWKPRRVVTVKVYHTRTVKYTKHKTFHVTHTPRVKSVTKVKYKPRASTRVKATKVTVRKGPKGTTVKKTTKTRTGKTKTTKKKRKR